MATQTPSDFAPTSLPPARARNRFAGGAILIILGIALLIGPLTNWRFSWAALPTLALIFLVWGLIVRQLGLLIPGGILAGLALGTTLTQTLDVAGGTASGGVILLCFAAGWVLITLLSPLTVQGFVWWPLIPGGIMGFIGAALLTGQTASLMWLNYAGPLALIVLGIWLVVRRPR